MTGGWLRRAFRLPATRRALDDDVAAELRFHLEGRVDELVAREGLSRAEAEREALRRFGDVEAYRRLTTAIDQHTFTRRRGMETLHDLRRELAGALHTLRRAPSFALIALVTLALGLGATTAVFTLLDHVVLRPLPYPNASRLIALGTAWPGIKAGEEYGLSRYMSLRFRADSRTLADVGLYVADVYPFPAEAGQDAERVLGADVTPSLFGVLDIRPALGRLFTAEEGIAADPRVVLIGDALWRRRFGADPHVVGRTIELGGRSLQIVGVLPPGASLPDRATEMWEPLRVDPADPPRNNHVYSGIGLLREGASAEQADAELRAITHRITSDFPNVYGAGFLRRTGFDLVSRPLRDEVVGPRAAQVLWILFASVGLVLLVSAANVANLFLVRAEGRRREAAVRAALGASRWQLAAHFLAESLALCFAAAMCAVALAWAMLHALLLVAPSTLPRLAEVRLDARGVAFCLGAAAVAAIVLGLLPLAAARPDAALLREGGRGLAGVGARSVARRALVMAQVALAVVLLAGAGLMLRSFQRLWAVRPGFDATGVLTMGMAALGPRYASDAQVAAFWHEVSRRVGALPGVTATGAIDGLPLDGGTGCTAVQAPDSPLPDPAQHAACVGTTTVAPGYFAALAIAVHGREPDWAAVERGDGEVVVSRALADRFWPGQDAVGKTLVYSMRRSMSFRVAGVAADVRADGLQKPPVEMAYIPLVPPATEQLEPGRWMDGSGLYFVVRAPSADLGQLANAIRHVMVEIDPQVPVADVRPMETIVARSVAQLAFTMRLLAILASVALVLSAVGIYGVVSYVVAQRRSEIGIRVALGARVATVGRLVVAQAMRLAVAGAVLGVVAALAGTRLLGALLFEVSPTDPLVLVSVPFVLLAVAAAASVVPARRAASIDPVEALRAR
ncbi:MAG: ABC transporter permease [Gemmatirosa sp.]|nr:ABC transporter permease [Gemmatirosa sp.]